MIGCQFICHVYYYFAKLLCDWFILNSYFVGYGWWYCYVIVLLSITVLMGAYWYSGLMSALCSSERWFEFGQPRLITRTFLTVSRRKAGCSNAYSNAWRVDLMSFVWVADFIRFCVVSYFIDLYEWFRVQKWGSDSIEFCESGWCFVRRADYFIQWYASDIWTKSCVSDLYYRLLDERSILLTVGWVTYIVDCWISDLYCRLLEEWPIL